MNKEADFKVIASGLAMVIITPILYVWETLAMSIVWGWFVTPVFGIATPPMPMIFGLNILWSLFATPPIEPKEPKLSDWMRIWVSFVRVAFLLLFAWIAKLLT